MPDRTICLINDSFPPVTDGVANAVVNYARAITESGSTAVVATPAYPGADDSALGFPVVRYPSIDMTKLVGYHAGFPFSEKTVKTLMEYPFDLIHCHCPITSAVLARELRSRIHVPTVFTYHTKFDIDIANAIHAKLLQEGAKKILVENISAFDEVWTVSHGAGENLRSLGYTGDWRVMPNGVDFAKGRVEEETVQEVCKDFDLPAGVPVFLFVGRMMWYKGLRITLDALKLLKDAGHAFRMVFVGNGGDKDEVVAYSKELGLDDCVFFTSPKYDRTVIRAWYCRADLFLFPSTFDTNGLVVREAAACELASVLVRGSCAAEDITDGRNGFLIEENADSMAALLAKLCHEPEVLKRVGRQAQEEIYISWDDAVHRAQQRYEIVIEQYRSGGHSARRRFSDEYYQSLGLCVDVLKRSREHLREQWDAFAEHFQ